MKYDFEVELPDNWESRWGEAEAAAKKYDILLNREGDRIEVRGQSPIGTIAADILIDENNTAHVKITKKPMVVPKSLIESEVRKALNKLRE
ncbi:MAG: hypothetical protein GF315_13710 [candidate division Zixibacteria bacterium]|nr:hypothetical protein [candidate division Zixibacteria bacterium]